MIALRPDDIPQDVWEAACEPSQVCFDASVDLYETGMATADGQAIIARAILAERERCAAVANERVAQLLAAYELPGDDETKAGYAGQVVEALLIEQRLKSGHVAKQSIQIDGLHKLAENTGFR